MFKKCLYFQSRYFGSQCDPHAIVTQMATAIFSYAFLLVIISTLAMIPIMMYIFNLRELGWMWQDAGLFAAMVASTDAVAVSALLKKGEHRLLNAHHRFLTSWRLAAALLQSRLRPTCHGIRSNLKNGSNDHAHAFCSSTFPASLLLLMLQRS